MKHVQILAALLLAGCARQPVGQVVAVVDGDEITRAELNAELRTAGAPGQGDPRTALNRLIDRRLLARIARERALDRTQDYLVRSRQLDDALLAQLLREQAAQAEPAPAEAAVSAYVGGHPELFAGRSGPEAQALAAQLLRDSQAAQALGQQLAAARARVAISYQTSGPAAEAGARPQGRQE